MGKQALQSGVQVLDDVSRGEDVKTAIKRRALACVNVVSKLIFLPSLYLLKVFVKDVK